MSEEKTENYDDDYSPTIITLTDEDGENFQFEILDEMDYKGEHYLAAVEYFEDPQESLESDGVLIVFRAGEEDEEGLETFDVVDDDEEYMEIGGIFEKRLEELFDPEE